MMFLTNFSPNTHKIPNYLSDEHYLQVRDDYSIYSLTSDRLKSDSKQNKFGKKRNSVEGKYKRKPNLGPQENKYGV